MGGRGGGTRVKIVSNGGGGGTQVKIVSNGGGVELKLR